MKDDDKPDLVRIIEVPAASLNVLLWRSSAQGLWVEVNYNHGDDSIEAYSYQEIDQLIGALMSAREYFSEEIRTKAVVQRDAGGLRRGLSRVDGRERRAEQKSAPHGRSNHASRVGSRGLQRRRTKPGPK